MKSGRLAKASRKSFPQKCQESVPSKSVPTGLWCNRCARGSSGEVPEGSGGFRKVPEEGSGGLRQS